MFFAYGLSLPLRGLYVFQPSAVILSDVVFLLLLWSWVGLRRWETSPTPFRLPECAFLSLSVWPLLAPVFCSASFSINSVARDIYLLAIFLFFRFASIDVNEKNAFIHGFLAGSVLTSLAGIFGVLLLSTLNINNPWAYALADYPYFDGFARAVGLSLGPNMLANYLAIALLLTTTKNHHVNFSRRETFLIRSVLLIGCIATLSRSLFALLAAVAIPTIMFKRPKEQRLYFFLISVLTAVIAVYVSANLVLKTNNLSQLEQIVPSNAQPLASFTIWTNLNLEVFTTVYYQLKKTAVAIFLNNFICGIGSGDFLTYLTINSISLNYPENFNFYNPHSTISGLLAERGIVGFAFCLVFVISLVRQANSSGKTTSELTFLWSVFIFLLLESINTDQLHFRHYFVFLAIYFQFQNYNTVKIAIDKITEKKSKIQQ